MKCLYITTDLMFSSRVSGVAQRVGVDLQTSGPATVVEGLSIAPDLVIIDLSTPGISIAELVMQVKAGVPSARVIAYGPHVHEAKLAAAQAAGCDAVFTRGQFDRDIAAILTA